MSRAEASESCVGLSVSFPHSQFGFPSFLRVGIEEVMVEKRLKAGDERKGGLEMRRTGWPRWICTWHKPTVRVPSLAGAIGAMLKSCS